MLKTELYNHFKSAHDIIIDTEAIQFLTVQEFTNWMMDIKKKSKCKYNSFIKERSATLKMTNYVCPRSGFFQTKSTGKCKTEFQGTRKINGFCPAQLSFSVDKDGTCKIYFIKTHIGHNNELDYLFLTIEERNMLVPFDVILDSICDTVCASIKKRDQFKIENSLNLQSTAVRHRNDAISVDTWMEEKKDSLFPEKKTVFIEEVLKELNSIDNDEELSIVQTILNSMSPALKAFYQNPSKSPGNQRNLYSNEDLATEKQELFPRR